MPKQPILDINRKMAFSPRLRGKPEKPEKAFEMTPEQLKAVELNLNTVRRYLGNLHVMILQPSPEQAERLQAQIAELGGEIQALSAKSS